MKAPRVRVFRVEGMACADWARKAAAERGDLPPGPQPVVTDADRRALAEAEAQIVARGC